VLGPVPDRRGLFEAAPDEELSPDREPRLPLQLEDRYVRRALLEGDRVATVAVDRQNGARQEARVRGEEARGRGHTVQVAALVTDDERRAVEQRQAHGGQSADIGSGTDRLTAAEIEEMKLAEI